MRKKKTRKKGKKAAKKAVIEKPAVEEEPETLTLDIPEEARPAPEEQPPEPEQGKDSGGMLKTLAIAVLVLAVLALAVYIIFIRPSQGFVPGSSVDSETFLQLFEEADMIYIFMDVRGVADDDVRRNILQCGVDFAGSSGMGPKDVTYFSIGEQGCVTPEGAKSDEYCFSQLTNGITIYVQKGETTSYYSNGVVVGVGKDYPIGTCGIHRS